MDYKSIIEGHYKDDTLDIPASALAPGDAARLIEKCVPEKRLLIQSITSKADDADGMTLIGEGGNAPFSGMSVELRFTWVGDDLRFQIKASSLTSWHLGKSFPSLENSLLEELRFESPTFLYLASDRVSEDINIGLTFDGTLQTGTGGLRNYGFLAAAAPTVRLTGSIDYQDGAPNMSLKAPLAARVSLGFLEISKIDVWLHIESRINSKIKAVQTESFVEFRALIELPARRKTYKIPLSAFLYNPENNIQFDAELTELVDATLDELALFLNSLDPKALIPAEVHLEDVIRLSHLVVQIDPKGVNKLRSVRLGIDTTRSWDVIKDVAGNPILAVEGLHLYFGLYAPFKSGGLQMGVVGEIGIGENGVLEMGASYPDFAIRGTLKTGTKIRLRELFSQIFGYGIQAVPDLSIVDMEVNIKPSESYSGSMDIRGDWEIPVGTNSLAIEEIVFAVDYQKSQGVTGSFEGIIALDAQDLRLSANHPAANEGWIFEGGSAPGQQLEMETLLGDLEYHFNVEFPRFISQLVVKDLFVRYATKNSDLSLTCETQFPLEHLTQDKWPDFSLDIALNHVDGRYIKHLSGSLSIAGLEFEAAIETGGSEDVFWGDYQNPGGKTFTVADILGLVTTEQALLDATQGLAFDIKDAFLGYYKGREKNAAAKWLLGLDMDVGADLTALPLVGKYIPKEESLRLTFQPRIATGDLGAAETEAFKGLIGGQDIPLPASLSKGVTLDIQLNIGGTTVPASLPVGLHNGELAGPARAPAPMPGTDDAPAEKISWFNLQKSFGPLQFQRVGIQFENGELGFLFDGGFSVGGLSLSLLGLEASTRLKPIDLSFDLTGLALDFRKDPIEIGGAFLKEQLLDDNHRPYTAYDGAAVIRAKQVSLSAIGSYADYQGHPSMFIYAVLDAPLGGPTFFFVTGLAAGFGFNRALKAPSIDQVKQFPLVAQAVAGVPDEKIDIATEIRTLHSYIPPASGEYFLAVGIRFTSFELIKSFALLMVSFGKRLELDLLGLSTLVLPGNTQAGVTPLAEVQLALKASFDPQVGFLGVEAKLTPASYLLSKSCHLTGGFAFYSWLSGKHEGDFALTLGGYHPSYRPPTHYPCVDRLGFNWVVSRKLSIKGDAYFALVPSAVMAGGHLNALWEDGNLRAWFTAGADFLLAWKPYHYDARIYVDVGVSYTYHFFGTHHITVDVGADLHIWGPDFAGTARVHLWIVTFHVAFGASSLTPPQPIKWEEFRASFLPPTSSDICRVSVKDGLEKKSGQGKKARFVISPKGCVLGIDSLIPFKSAKLRLSDDSADDQPLALDGSNTNWGVGPMGMSIGDTDSRVVLTIKQEKDHVGHQFTISAVNKSVPTALWGQSVLPSLNGDRLIDEVACGFEITGLPPTPPHQSPQFIPEDKFRFSMDTLPNSWQWSDLSDAEPPAAIPLNAPDQEAQRRDYLRKHIETVQSERTELLRQLGFGTPVFPDKAVADAFVVAPRLSEATA
ncbi:DUF6603 domain-containing protein [Halomonas cerina]|uniref:DUF6603 domain-containing protein n=1 Tax=Halomonas cerina TaxID=447424 RepID=A0A839V5F7_9GAMM|nr:DUF6603 domain-containing protein [Halomonas cerina]MBB3190622.1 hypothetical protein [Halomonas cerina]